VPKTICKRINKGDRQKVRLVIANKEIFALYLLQLNLKLSQRDINRRAVLVKAPESLVFLIEEQK